MDALSHALLGVAVAGLSGHPLTLTDPIYLACVLGAQAPDLDIISIVRGNFALLRQHRSFSHSIPGIAIWSSLIAAIFFIVYPGAACTEVFMWAFWGGLSHSILDFFNAHGAAVLWPFSRERKSFSLLNVFDPFLLAIMLTVFMQQLPARETSLLFFLSISLYIGIRYLLKLLTIMRLKQYFAAYSLIRLLVMPSLKSVLSWDFVAETQDRYYVGQVGLLQQCLTIHTKFTKQTLSPATQKAHKTVLGEFFSSFTPFSYFTEYQDNEHAGKLVHIYDLRYFFKQDFLHSATIIFDCDQHPCDSYIKTSGRIIKIPC